MSNLIKKILGPLAIGGRLRNKIFRAVFLVAVLPLIVSGPLAFYFINLSHNADVASIESNLVNQKVEEVRNFVNDNLNLLDVIFALNVSSLVEVLGGGTPSEKGESVLTSSEGEKIKFLVKPTDLESILKNILAISPAIDEVYFVDGESGREVAYLGRFPNFPERDKSFLILGELPQIKEAVKGRRYVGEVNYTQGAPVVSIASPVRNKNGKVIGVLAAELNLAGLGKVFERITLGHSGYVYLLDESGNLIHRSTGGGGARANLSNIGFVPDILKGKDMLEFSKESKYTSFWGEKVFAAGRSLGDERFNWLVVAEWPEEDASRAINTLRNQFLVFSFLVLILTLVLSVFLANKIVKPIKILEAGTEKVAEGKFDEPVQIRTKDEIEDLGAAFNNMMRGLKRLQELKDEFVFVAAHELRTPVTAIRGYISLALDSKEKIAEEVRKFLGEVKKASDRLNQLVNDLLQIARSEAGRLEIRVAPIDITEPINSVLSELKPLADEKSIKITYEPGKTVPKILADPQRLKEVMVNLIGNAIKYSPSGRDVAVSHDIEGSELITHVADTGFGISKEAQKRLFEKFYRVQTDKTANITGTGLGLFIVKQIIEKMNGKIWVESEEGKGSVFSFSLPIAK